MEYIELISKIENRHTRKSIFAKSLGALSDTFILSLFNSIYKLYKDEKIESIAFLDKGFYETFKHKGDNVYFISLDLKKSPAENATIDYQEIGVLNSQDNMKHSFFNELSAIKLNGKFIAKLPFKSKDTESFLKTFNQKARTCNQELLHKNNCLNLYINFTDNDPTIFLRSMDSNVPCILGNTELLDHNEYLKKYLVLKSDDDINEISEKIDLVSKNREKILKEYQTFRDNYSNQSKKLVETFLNCEIETEEENQKNDLLLSIVVPVYNVEKYLEKSLDSILEALIEKENVEILLINDGSKDDSEKIIEKYAKQYPKLIRYIKQENHGLGNVRNVGLAEARGKYIASIDSDDTINIDFFKDAIEYLNKDVDVVIYDWLTITTETKFETSASDWVFNNDNWNRYEALLYTTIMPSTCNKIIKSSLFKELGIKYIEDKFEDLSTNPFILFRSKE